MGEALSTAVLVLGVGMITVFTILFLVVLSGQVLIKVVNRFAGNPGKIATKAVQTKSIAPKKLAAILASVELITQGQGSVLSIEKE